MHDTAYTIGRLFFENYWRPEFGKIVDLGSLNVNGSLRECAPAEAIYVGLDIEPGKGVDIVMAGDSRLPLADDSTDMAVSSSVLEHDQFFWNTFLELVRITRPGGYIYVNAPSNGSYHRYPVDNWRFYADAARALEAWAARSGSPVTLVESFIAERQGDIWNDFVAVFSKGAQAPVLPKSFLCDIVPRTNVRRFGEGEILGLREPTQDMALLWNARQMTLNDIADVVRPLIEDPLQRASQIETSARAAIDTIRPELAELRQRLVLVADEYARRDTARDDLSMRLARDAAAIAGGTSDLNVRLDRLEGESARLSSLNAELTLSVEEVRQLLSALAGELRHATGALGEALALEAGKLGQLKQMEQRLAVWAEDSQTLRATIMSLQITDAANRAHAANLERYVALIKSSTSWRLTKPLRFIKSLITGR